MVTPILFVAIFDIHGLAGSTIERDWGCDYFDKDRIFQVRQCLEACRLLLHGRNYRLYHTESVLAVATGVIDKVPWARLLKRSLFRLFG